MPHNPAVLTLPLFLFRCKYSTTQATPTERAREHLHLVHTTSGVDVSAFWTIEAYPSMGFTQG